MSGHKEKLCRTRPPLTPTIPAPWPPPPWSSLPSTHTPICHSLHHTLPGSGPPLLLSTGPHRRPLRRIPSAPSAFHSATDNFLPLSPASDDAPLEPEGESEEVKSYGSPFHHAQHDNSGEEDNDDDEDIIWMPTRDILRVQWTAYAYISNNGPVSEPSPFIHDALFSVAPDTFCRIIPSSFGHMMVKFETMVESEAMVSHSPIAHVRTTLTLVHGKEAENHTSVKQSWLVAVSAKGFSEEHWHSSGICNTFSKLGTMVEIDIECLLDDDYSRLRVAVVQSKPDGICIWFHAGNPSQDPDGKAMTGPQCLAMGEEA